MDGMDVPDVPYYVCICLRRAPLAEGTCACVTAREYVRRPMSGHREGSEMLSSGLDSRAVHGRGDVCKGRANV